MTSMYSSQSIALILFIRESDTNQMENINPVSLMGLQRASIINFKGVNFMRLEATVCIFSMFVDTAMKGFYFESYKLSANDQVIMIASR